jgi:hypothetical protein
MILGNLLGGVLGDHVGATPVVVVAGALSVLAGTVAILTVRGDTARRASDGLLARPYADEERVL